MPEQGRLTTEPAPTTLEVGAPAPPAIAAREDQKLGAVVKPSGEVDLTGEVADPAQQQLSPERRLWVEELARISLALSFVLLFAGTVIWACGAALWASPAHWGNVKDLLQSLLPAETSLLGGAVAFYFATKK
jgi:hypothetical protein